MVGRVQCPCYQEHGGGEDIAVQVIAQEAELKAIAKSAPKSKHLLKSCVLGTSLASPQSITCEQECDDLTGYSSSVQPQEILQLSSVQSIPVLPCSICLTLSTRLFSLLNLTEVGSAVL